MLSHLLNDIMIAAAKGIPVGAASGSGGAPPPSPLPTILMIVVLIAIFYVTMILPNKRKQKEREQMLSKLKKGDRIMTVGGIYGTVSEVKDKSVMVEIAPKTVVEFTRMSIHNVIRDDDDSSKDSKDKQQS